MHVERMPPVQTFYSTYGSGVALDVDGVEVIVDIGTMGHARREAVTAAGEPIDLTDAQLEAAEAVFDVRLHADVPEVW